MANDVHTQSEPGLASLVQGIVSDLGDLIKQEIRFARTEMKSDLQRSTVAITYLTLGAGIGALGVLFLATALVFLLHWLTAPAGTDPANIPLWGCFAIFGGGFLLIGACLLGLGRAKFNFNPLPDQTAQTVKENVEWITSSK